MGLFRSFITEQEVDIIEEGGLGGHMKHPTEVMNASELLEFFERFFSGSIKGTEKVDGVNLFIGYDEKQGTLYARNQSEKPSSDIDKKFPLIHPGAAQFRAGFKAISTAFKNLSIEDKQKYNLIDSNGKSKYFINCEILYGEIPNIIQYSETKNYIVFHSFHQDSKAKYELVDTSDDLLKELASQISNVKVSSDVVYFIGRPGKVTTKVKQEVSDWDFRGPIQIDYDKMKEELRTLAHDWKELDEYKHLKKLKDAKNISKEQLTDAMKALTTKIGNKVLTTMISDLFSGQRKTAEDHPKIEGIALKDPKYGTIKLTGDFRNKAMELWGPVLDKIPEIENKTKTVIHSMLGFTGTKVLKKTWDKLNGSAEEFLKFKNPKLYSNQDELNKEISKQDLIKILKDSLKELGVVYKEAESSNNIKKDFVLKNIRVSSMKIQKLLAKVPEIKNRIDLMDAYYKTFYIGE